MLLQQSAMPQLASWLEKGIDDPLFHARWLNTLSYLENCGARMIAWSEHPTMVTREVLKHASEEFRHAYYLKAQITKVWAEGLKDYRAGSLVGGLATLQLMKKLNVRLSRWLIEEVGVRGGEMKALAYLLVTYAIEVRALEIYLLYEELLKGMGPEMKVSIRSIIREEEHHLAEVEEELRAGWSESEVRGFCERVLEIESVLFDGWFGSVLRVV